MKHSARQYGTIRSSLVCVSIAALGFVAAACDSSSSSNTGSASGVGTGFSGNFTVTSINGVVPASFTTAACTLGTCDTFTNDTLTIVGQVDPFVASLQISLNGSTSTYPVSTSGTFSFAVTLTDALASTLAIIPFGAGGVKSGAETDFNVYAHSAAGLAAPSLAALAPATSPVTDAVGTSLSFSSGAYQETVAEDANSITITGTIASTDSASAVAPNFIKFVSLNGSTTPCSLTTFSGSLISWTCTTSLSTGSSQTYQLVTIDSFGNQSAATSVTVTTADTPVNLIAGGGGLNSDPVATSTTINGTGHDTLIGLTATQWSVPSGGQAAGVGTHVLLTGDLQVGAQLTKFQ